MSGPVRPSRHAAWIDKATQVLDDYDANRIVLAADSYNPDEIAHGFTILEELETDDELDLADAWLEGAEAERAAEEAARMGEAA